MIKTMTRITAYSPEKGERVFWDDYRYPPEIALQIAKWQAGNQPDTADHVDFEAEEREIVWVGPLDMDLGYIYHTVEVDERSGKRRHVLDFVDHNFHRARATMYKGYVTLEGQERAQIVLEPEQIEGLVEFVERAELYEATSELAETEGSQA